MCSFLLNKELTFKWINLNPGVLAENEESSDRYPVVDISIEVVFSEKYSSAKSKASERSEGMGSTVHLLICLVKHN